MKSFIAIFWFLVAAAQILATVSKWVDPLEKYYTITNEQSKQDFDLAEECCATRCWKSNLTHPCQVITRKNGRPSPVPDMSNDRVLVIRFIYHHLVSTRQSGPVNPNLDNGFIMAQSPESAADYALVEECYYDTEWKSNYSHQCQWITRKCDFPFPRVPDMSYQRLITLRAIYQNYMASEPNDRSLVYQCFHKHSNEKQFPDCLGITWHYPAQSPKNTLKTRRQEYREQLYRGLYRLDYLSGICTLMPEEEPDCADYFRVMKTNPPHLI